MFEPKHLCEFVNKKDVETLSNIDKLKALVDMATDNTFKYYLETNDKEMSYEDIKAIKELAQVHLIVSQIK